MQIAQTNYSRILIPLTALAIAVFMTLPRIAIMAYLRINPEPRISQISWADLGSKCLYAFLVAWLFLALNTANINIATGIRTIKTSKFGHRLLINILLFLLIRWLFRISGIAEESGLRPGKGAVFLFNISLMLEVSFCILIAEIYRLFRKNQEHQLRNEVLLKVNAEAKFEVLKNQVNPHFLFNSLNTINAVIDRDISAAKKFVANMSQVYRHILNSAGRPVITLGEELEFTIAYISMLLERHSKSLLIEIQVPDEYKALFLPPVSLQVLIENAVKHNVAAVNNPLKIIVSGQDGCIIVSNKMSERKLKSVSTGTGLWNLDQRYRHLCGSAISISNKDRIFTVALPLLKLSGNKYIPV